MGRENWIKAQFWPAPASFIALLAQYSGFGLEQDAVFNRVVSTLRRLKRKGTVDDDLSMMLKQ